MSYVARSLPSKAVRRNAICSQCRLRLHQSASITRQFSVSSHQREAVKPVVRLVKQWRREYFSANPTVNQWTTAANAPESSPESLRSIQTVQNAPKSLETTPQVSTVSNQDPSIAQEPPHRRRKRLKSVAATSETAFLPPNSSSTLSTLSSRLPATSLRRLFATCLSLSKPRLSVLIILTTTTAYALYPVPALLLPATTTSPSLSAITLLFLTTGTGLCAASANALNMLMEPKYDAMMSRTRNRPLVRGLIGKKGAAVFAAIAGLAGVGSLWFGTNPTVAGLGALNIFLYAGVYTPLKRISVLNTWAGALVGGIPPLMGWAAAAGQNATGSGGWQELLFSEESVGGWLLAGLLFAWQFPHFNSLSWSIRDEYRNAGYRMLAWTNPRANGRVALRYAVLCFPICAGLWWFGITDRGFLVTSSVVNGWMVKEAWRFWRLEGHKGSARGLFWASVWHLPGILCLAMLHKAGSLANIWHRVFGEEEDDKLRGSEALPVV